MNEWTNESQYKTINVASVLLFSINFLTNALCCRGFCLSFRAQKSKRKRHQQSKRPRRRTCTRPCPCREPSTGRIYPTQWIESMWRWHRPIWPDLESAKVNENEIATVLIYSMRQFTLSGIISFKTMYGTPSKPMEHMKTANENEATGIHLKFSK